MSTEKFTLLVILDVSIGIALLAAIIGGSICLHSYIMTKNGYEQAVVPCISSVNTVWRKTSKEPVVAIEGEDLKK